jgi:hypothetical protein
VNLILLLKELWRRRLLVAAAALAAALIAAFAVYDMSFAPPALKKRAEVEARGSIDILVDSARSPIADVDRDLEPLTARAGVFARYIAGGNVIRRIAEQTGIRARQIEVGGPVPLPGEAPGSGAPPPQLLPYGIEIVQQDDLPILDVATRAPTVAQARDLAAATPAAVRQIVYSIQREQGIPDRKRVTFRSLGPAQAHIVTDANGAKLALLLFLVLFTLGVLLILALPRLVAAWRAIDEQQPPQPGEDESQLHVLPRLAAGETEGGLSNVGAERGDG